MSVAVQPAPSHPSSCCALSLSGSLFVSEYFSQSAQRLSFYSWYGNAKVFHFHVPEDTVLLRWLLQASRGKEPECTSMEVTVYVCPLTSACTRSLSYLSFVLVTHDWSCLFAGGCEFICQLEQTSFLNITLALHLWFLTCWITSCYQLIKELSNAVSKRGLRTTGESFTVRLL